MITVIQFVTQSVVSDTWCVVGDLLHRSLVESVKRRAVHLRIWHRCQVRVYNVFAKLFVVFT